MTSAAGKPKLLVLTTTFPRWKDDHEPPFVYELARRLTDSFEVTVLAPHTSGSLVREEFDGLSVRRFRYAPARLELLAYQGGIPARIRRKPWLVLLLPLFVGAMIASTAILLRKLKPSTIHAHWIIPGGWIASFVRRVLRQPARLVVTVHGGDIFGFRHPIFRYLKKSTLYQADCVTVVSKAIGEELLHLGVNPDKIRVRSMGVDIPKNCKSRLNPPIPTLVYAGRLVEKKGIDTLIRAAAIVSDVVPEIRVVIAGHGPIEPELKQLANQLGIHDKVSFSGPYTLEQLPGIYARASLAIFPFRAIPNIDQDGLGLAVLEAMSCEVPVLASDLQPLDDILSHGRTALRAPADQPEAFAEQIIDALNNPDAAAERAARARMLVEKEFAWPKVAARYSDYLVNDHSNPVPPYPGDN